MFGAAFVLPFSATAIGASSVLPPRAMLAQQDDQKLNPTNDSDVQKGITKAQIDYCARQHEAGMTQSEIWKHDADIRYRCANPPAVAAVRG